MSQVQQFYEGKTIFVTGGTGFLGKLLIEKLLRSCPNVRNIYLLVREKDGKSIKERVDSALVDPVFKLLRDEYPDFAEKVTGVKGDVGEERLGLSDLDYGRLVNEVSAIFHLAATVRSDEKICEATRVNVNGTKHALDLARACKKLEAVLHVSDAFSNCVRKTIDEELYPPPLNYEKINQIIEDVGRQGQSDEETKRLTKGIIGEWPNVYTFTKSVAEDVVKEFGKDLPVAIFRPSVVVNTYKEPVPGWVNGPTGLLGMLYAYSRGMMHVTWIDPDTSMDIVPVDYVCNSLICCGWETAITEKRQREDVPVYNYVCGTENSLPWKKRFGRIQEFCHNYPTNSSVYYPTAIMTKSLLLYNVLEFFWHKIPALVFDAVGKLFGKDLKLLNMAYRVRELTLSTGYFSTQQWTFKNTRVQRLWERMGANDKTLYPFNMNKIHWDEQTMKMMRGIRAYIAGDTEDNRLQAGRRNFYLHIIHVLVCLLFGISLLWIVWKSFCGRSLNITADYLSPKTFASLHN